MDYNKSKYTTMPENSYFDRRMANGDELSDIFDHVNKYGHPFSDKGCPILVQVGKLYNYVLNNFILFDSWFVIAIEFGYAKWSYAYRRFNEKGIREGGVLFRRDGSYITREEFLPMLQGLGHTIVLSPDFSEKGAQPLTCREILYMLENTLQMEPFGNLQQAGILTEQLQPYFADEQKVPARAEVVMLMANAYAYAEQQGSPE